MSDKSDRVAADFLTDHLHSFRHGGPVFNIDVPSLSTAFEEYAAEAVKAETERCASFSVASSAVRGIVHDLSDRRGLKNQWERIDREIRHKIHLVWRNIIVSHIRAGSAEAPKD